MKIKSILNLFITILILFTSQPAFADIFDNFNDGVIDTHKWDLWEYWTDGGDIRTAAPVYEANGSLNIDYPPSSSWGGLRSKAIFGGDFDFRTEWKNWQFDGVPNTYENYVAQIGIDVQHHDSTGSDSTNIFRGWTSTFPEGYHDVYMSYAYVDNAWHSGTGNLTTQDDTSGYFGIERIGSTINTYYSDTNHQSYDRWELLHQVNNASTEPVKLKLAAYTGDNTNSFHAEWDNVEVEADREVDIDFWNVGKRVVEWADRFKTSIDLLSALKQASGRPLGIPLPSMFIPADLLLIDALKSDPFLIYQYPEFFEGNSPTLGYISFSPVDLQVTNPLGNSIGKTHNDFSNALYFEGDFWNTGITNDMVLFWDSLYGDYEINIIPEIGAQPLDTFSLLAFDDTTRQKYVSTLAFGEEITNQDIKNFDYNTIPEPSSLLLLSLGVSFLFSRGRRKIN